MLLSVPIINKINYYEEKIIMLVTRCNFKEADVEISKMRICIDVLTADNDLWMTYNYLELLTSKEVEYFSNEEV